MSKWMSVQQNESDHPKISITDKVGLSVPYILSLNKNTKNQ